MKAYELVELEDFARQLHEQEFLRQKARDTTTRLSLYRTDSNDFRIAGLINQAVKELRANELHLTNGGSR